MYKKKCIIADDIQYYIPYDNKNGEWVQDGRQVALRSEIEQMPDAEIELAKHLKRAELCSNAAIALWMVSATCNIILLLRLLSQGG